MNTINTIQSRISHRTYKPESLSDDILSKIESIIQNCPPGPFKINSEFRLIQKSFPNGQKVKLGTYGMISGAQYFIAGKTVPEPTAFIDFGYRMEWIILQLTALDLGTCWLGGTFSRSEFAKFFEINNDEIIPAVSPVGFPSGKLSIKDKLVRFGAGSNYRKPWDVLFFDEQPDRPLSESDCGKFAQVLEMVRQAPSASNRQPWRIIKENNIFHFYLQRIPGYKRFSTNLDLQKVDMGIALCHFDLAVKELSLPGNWIKYADKLLEHSQMEYILSWESVKET